VNFLTITNIASFSPDFGNSFTNSIIIFFQIPFGIGNDYSKPGWGTISILTCLYASHSSTNILTEAFMEGKKRKNIYLNLFYELYVHVYPSI